MARIDAFLKLGLAQGCSDVHLAVGVPPMLRMNGDLLPIKFRQLSDTELEGADFRLAEMPRVDMSNAEVTRTAFTEAILSSAILTGIGQPSSRALAATST